MKDSEGVYQSVAQSCQPNLFPWIKNQGPTNFWESPYEPSRDVK